MPTHFAEICRELLALPLTVIDVGADGGVTELRRLGSLCHVHAFEPRPDSFARLVNDTDQSKLFAKINFHNIALAATAGKHRLYITRVPQASSLRRPNQEIVRRYTRNNLFDVVGEEDVECITLDDFADTNRIDYVDFLKIDTQGTELDILLGGRKLLNRISIISAEVEFVELYQGQKLFDDVVRELSNFGFRFVDFNEGDRVGPSVGKRIWANALFVRDARGLERQSALRCAVIMMDMGYFGEAMWMLRGLGVDENDIAKMRDAATPEDNAKVSIFGAAFKRLSAYNHARRDAGKMSINGYRVIELFRKLTFGVLD
jgi:FkbM family methyltransferase